MTQPRKPDFLTWDLDPDAAVAWEEVMGAAFLIRDFLKERGLTVMLKTSGGKGLHLVLRIKRSYEWEVMRKFTKAVAARIAELNPERFTITASKSKRKGRIFIDWMRNGEGTTCVAPWSRRARMNAPVSMPIEWADLETAQSGGFTIHEPPVIPEEWKEPKAQVIGVKFLRELGI